MNTDDLNRTIFVGDNAIELLLDYDGYGTSNLKGCRR